MHKLELTDQQLATIARALQELPYKVAAPLFAAIQSQLEAEAPEEKPDDGNQ